MTGFLSSKKTLGSPAAVAILVLGAVLRLLALDNRPAHFDEGVNGWFVDRMTYTGFHHYDPTNFHGPLHFYALFLGQTLLGRNLWALRLPVALVSIACIWLVLRFQRFFDRTTCLVAALALAVSPACVFFGRDAIHETWMLFFLLSVFYGICGLTLEGRRWFLWPAGVGLAGMILTKETYAIHVACFALAAIVLFAWEKKVPSEPTPPPVQTWKWDDANPVVIVSCALIFFFYSGNFFDPGGLSGLYETFFTWVRTAGVAPGEGSGQEKHFLYWLVPMPAWPHKGQGLSSLLHPRWNGGLLARYEQPALLGLIFCAWQIGRANRLMRYLAVYGAGTLLAYSLIPYKTPWCILSIIWPFFFLFGRMVSELSTARSRTLVWSASALLLVVSLILTVRVSFFRYDNAREPYVYVQTYCDIRKLTGPLHELVKQDPSNYHLTGHIVLSSEYPLPWLLEDFPSVGYFSEGSTPPDWDAAFLLVQKSRVKEAEKNLRRPYFAEKIGVRDSLEKAKLFLNPVDFGTLFPDRQIEFVPVKKRMPGSVPEEDDIGTVLPAKP